MTKYLFRVVLEDTGGIIPPVDVTGEVTELGWDAALAGAPYRPGYVTAVRIQGSPRQDPVIQQGAYALLARELQGCLT